MSSQLLLLLKFSLLALLYLFLVRVVRAVWAELATPAPSDAYAPAPQGVAVPSAVPPSMPPAMPLVAPGSGDAPGRGRGVPKATPPTGAVAAVELSGSPAGGGGQPGAPARLVVVAPPGLAGQAVEVGAAGVLVGRGAGCDLVVEDSYVSQRHLRVSVADPDSWWVDDLGSTNGTYVGGERVVAPRLVRRGEQVSIGGVVVELQ